MTGPSGRAHEVSLLRGAGLRVTPQRLAIAQAVACQHHPTVAEVYEAVRQRFPTIGLATVYATLHGMAEHGLVRPLPFQNVTRYDANTEPHANLICTSCGKITDFDGCRDILTFLHERARSRLGFSLEQERVDLLGRCADCQLGLKPSASA
jgi:Fur family transcriptional regulator, peroxide stress response regulator